MKSPVRGKIVHLDGRKFIIADRNGEQVVYERVTVNYGPMAGGPMEYNRFVGYWPLRPHPSRPGVLVGKRIIKQVMRVAHAPSR